MLSAHSTAPFTSLLLILTVTAGFLTQTSGFPILVTKVDTSCMDDIRTIVVTVHSNDTVQLNSEDRIDRNQLPERLQEIFHTRADRSVFVRADSDVSFQEFVDVLDAARPQIDRFGWITPGISDEWKKSPCGVFGLGAQ